jgi:hypothetical protein
MLPLNRQTIYNWFDAGTLPSVPDAHPLRSRLNRLVDDGYRQPPAPPADEDAPGAKRRGLLLELGAGQKRQSAP